VPKENIFSFQKCCKLARHWWLIPVILATQKAEIWRITVQSNPGQIVKRDPISKKPITKKGWWSG
jgi:hypothetical protein